METIIGLILGLIIIVFVILLIRTFGAWMLRIDEVIEVQKEILKELKKHSGNLEKDTTPRRITNFCKNCGTIIQPDKLECPKCGIKSEK